MEAILGGAAGTSEVNASCVPSGDQEMPAGGFSKSVSLAIWPESIQRMYSWGLPSRSETKARRVPSGDQRGDESEYVPVVKARWLVPSVLMTQRLETRRSVE